MVTENQLQHWKKMELFQRELVGFVRSSSIGLKASLCVLSSGKHHGNTLKVWVVKRRGNPQDTPG